MSDPLNDPASFASVNAVFRALGFSPSDLSIKKGRRNRDLGNRAYIELDGFFANELEDASIEPQFLMDGTNIADESVRYWVDESSRKLEKLFDYLDDDDADLLASALDKWVAMSKSARPNPRRRSAARRR